MEDQISQGQRYDKKFHLENARSLLAQSCDQSAKYAALELRFLIEAHVYQRLLHGVDELPRSVIDKWEPNKAMKMLSMFDDIADMDLKLTLSEQDGSNPVTIESLNIPNTKLSSFYNALGSFLHLPQPMKVRDYKLKTSKIKEIFSALEKIASGPLIIQKIEYKSFDCERCHKPIIYTEHFIENQESISCQNINCGLNYAIKYLGTEVLFGANSLFPCSDCGTEVSVATQDIKEGTESECPGCKTVYRFYLNLSPKPKAEPQ